MPPTSAIGAPLKAPSGNLQRQFAAVQLAKGGLGTLLWLVSPASAFVTGVVVPVDGGFSSFSGV